MPHEHEACRQSTDICKLFITLASASLAFIINLIIEGQNIMPSWVKYPSILFMGVSIGAGVFALLHLTFTLSQGKYDINSRTYRNCVGTEIVSFSMGVIPLGIWALFFA